MTCQRNAQAGTTTTVELVNPAAYGEKYGTSDPNNTSPQSRSSRRRLERPIEPARDLKEVDVRNTRSARAPVMHEEDI